MLLNILGEWFKERDYQLKWWENMSDFTKKRLRFEIENTKNIDLWTSMPVLMATWSGKTPTVGLHLHKIFFIRDRLEKIHNTKYPIRMLVLNDRINLVNQVKEDFIDGRGGKSPLLGKDITKYATIKIYHSKTWKENPEDVREEDVQEDVIWNGTDEIYFSTFGSAKKFLSEQKWRDIIIIDESHHLSAPTYMKILQREIAKNKTDELRNKMWFWKWRNWENEEYLPLVIPMSATMDSIRHLVNDPVVNFPLAEYIAHEDSPKINYNLISNSDFSEEDLTDIMKQIDEISMIQDFKEKKQKIAEIRSYIEEHLARFTDLSHLCDDLLNRLPSIDHTIIFAHSIDEVNEITAELNQQAGEDIAIAIHSKIDEESSEVLDQYNRGKKKIIVAVDMLNEGIDMPQTNNVVFWRNTKSPTVFQQQFGRGLRGTQVNFYDYTGVLVNMSYINGINQAIKDLDWWWGWWWGGWERKSIAILFGDIKWGYIKEHTVSLEDIVQKTQELEDSINLPELWEDGQIVIEWKIYQWVWANTPSEQLWWLRWYNIVKKIRKQPQEWKDEYIKKARSIRWPLNVIEINALKELLKDDMTIAVLWQDNQVQIDEKNYQRVGRHTPPEQLWWLQWYNIVKKIEKQLQEWKDTYIKKAKSKGWEVSVVEINALKELLQDDVIMSELWEDGQIVIEWKIYQWVWYNTPSEQLWWLRWENVARIIKKQPQKWKDEYIKKAKSKTWRVDVVETNALKELLQDDVIMSELWEDGQIVIEWKIYQWVWYNTPSEQLWWLQWYNVVKKIKKQSQEWKDQYIKKAKSQSWPVDVLETNALKELLNI